MENQPKVLISFRSYSRDREEGYEIQVSSEATEEDVRKAAAHAALARRLCRLEITVGLDGVEA